MRHMQKENATISLKIKSPPVAKKRPRFAYINGKIITYDEQHDEKATVKAACLKALEDAGRGTHGVLTGDIELQMKFIVKIRKSFSKKNKEKLEGTRHNRRPDIDNYIKFYLDCMNNTIFRDDAQVFKIVAEASYSQTPGVNIKVIEHQRLGR